MIQTLWLERLKLNQVCSYFMMLYQGKWLKKSLESLLTRYFFCPSESKKWIDPKVIELQDNSEPEVDFDCIPPSPGTDETSYTLSSLQTR